MQARLQLLEAEHRAAILSNERQERDGVTRESGWAKRRGEMTVWEARCRAALLGIYWGRAEELGRWAVATVQWRLRKVQQQRYLGIGDQGKVTGHRRRGPICGPKREPNFKG